MHTTQVGDEVNFEVDYGRRVWLKLAAISETDSSCSRQVTFEVNGERWFFRVTDEECQNALGKGGQREKLSRGDPSGIGALLLVLPLVFVSSPDLC